MHAFWLQYMLRIIMSIFWRDLIAHRWHWFSLIYFLGSSIRYVPKIWLPSIVSNILVYGVIAVSNLNYLHLETGPTGGWRTNAFPDRLVVYLILSVSIPGLSWLFGFDFSHVVDIPIYGNRLWSGLTLPLRSGCWACKEILDLTEQSWIFHTNYVKRVSRIWKILVNRVGRWEYDIVDPYGIMASNGFGYPYPNGRAKIIILCCQPHPFYGNDFLCLFTH